MNLVSTRVLASAIGVLAVTAALPEAAAAGPLTLSPQTVQTIGLDYSGFSCPLQPVYAVPDVNTTLALTTETNFTSAVTFAIPALHISVPLPWTPAQSIQYIRLGRLSKGTIPFEIDAPPTTGSYGPSCHGAFEVGRTRETA